MSKPTRRDSYTGCCYYSNYDKMWVAEFRWKDSMGKNHRKVFRGKSENVIRSKMDDFSKSLLANPDNPLYFGSVFKVYAEHWLNDVEKIKLKPNSFQRKAATFKNQLIPVFGDKLIKNITLPQVQQFVNSLHNQGYSRSTIKKSVECLNCCIRYYYLESGIFGRSPCEGVVLPRNESKEIRVFTDKECEKIEEEALRTYSNGKYVYRLGPGIIFLLYTGLRIGEALALTWNDIDFENRTIRVNKNVAYEKVSDTPGEKYDFIVQKSTKTKSGNRVVPMMKKAYDMLKLIYGITGHQEQVFITSTGSRVQLAYFNRCFHKLLNNCGLTSDDETVGVHALRHTFATRLFRSGCDIKVISTILGHSTVRITYDIYIGIIQAESVKAITNLDKYFE